MEVNIMIRYGELSTKGKNKKNFIQQLAYNVKKALRNFPSVKVRPEYDFMYLDLNGALEHEVLPYLEHVFGIQSYSPVYKVDKDFSQLSKQVVQLLADRDLENKTFKIAAKRSDHEFYMDTQELNLALGQVVLQAYPQLSVRMKQPDIQIKVDVRREAIYVSTQVYKGAGGLPVGTSGRGMMMLSGGIDSPVASYLALKRGLDIEMVHFYSPPYTSPQSLRKTQELTKKLAKYGGTIQFIEVPFTKIQEAIKANCPDTYLMTLTRRFMLRITDELRQKRKGLVILNGESIGQVASQTLHSMIAINEVTNTPILRPVAAMDKLEIIQIAEQIDTFELSIQPFEDCCTVFAPPSPKTKPNLDKVHHYEEKLDVDALIQEAVNHVKIYPISSDTSFEEDTKDMDELL
ncbi:MULTISPECIES: tRNA uracil 4-sulfurtransferase ThiI [unclassified Granulicatella]|uniref:tRNA uracil 4-sulfurtransferase ThiI n=1 Tax=unclassified Granulicatella TaxID=2630493 RepID=UPI001073A851|nr:MULTISPECIES: tRNA uracil 4-sulfurtransferase ThiI [unclassified Granulicatella]MBF0780227.1 tRNA 4-thiouridine(8) synthase ThiI [Granulicatella sp. 19428wC4_WM01]TFU95661.1 tRNA 4-thiouridine(8) synthase ThiI [Granulicatella sp. WM01]